MATATKSRPKAGGATKSRPKAVGTPKVQPLADRVVIRANEREEMTVSGIVLPDTAREKPQEGTVIAVGPGRLDEKGSRATMEVKVDDTVLYARYAGTEVKIGGEELLILKETDVLAVLK